MQSGLTSSPGLYTPQFAGLPVTQVSQLSQVSQVSQVSRGSQVSSFTGLVIASQVSWPPRRSSGPAWVYPPLESPLSFSSPDRLRGSRSASPGPHLLPRETLDVRSEPRFLFHERAHRDSYSISHSQDPLRTLQVGQCPRERELILFFIFLNRSLT